MHVGSVMRARVHVTRTSRARNRARRNVKLQARPKLMKLMRAPSVFLNRRSILFVPIPIAESYRLIPRGKKSKRRPRCSIIMTTRNNALLHRGESPVRKVPISREPLSVYSWRNTIRSERNTRTFRWRHDRSVMTRRVDNFSIYAKLFKTETFQFEETKVEALLYVFILKNPKRHS